MIEGGATAFSGNVTFAVKFYSLDSSGKKFIYNLNTIPSTSKVLHGMNASSKISDYIYEIDVAQDILNRIIVLEEQIANIGEGDFDIKELAKLNQRIDELEERINNLDFSDINLNDIAEIKIKL